MTTLTIAAILPARLNGNGDAENAKVLALRARQRGVDAVVVQAGAPSELGAEVHAVVVGSCDDPSLEAVRDELLGFRERFTAWMEAGVPIIAVANGWKLLTERVEIRRGEWIDGLGIIAGEAPLRGQRASDDLVADTPEGHRLVGYENHLRDYAPGSGVSPLGAVAHGRGNGNGQEGAIAGAFIGTHLHGPVLAKNPELADRILERAALLAGASQAMSPATGRLAELDEFASQSRRQILDGLSITRA